ncbi:PhzF family phenazine biosynthesis protein [Paraferrimonas sp. SM1919]|uniref:PhzF family phenazine biosynthesis protein n=1 Tax=Paraferrimonas sp. SM1919 TaxID=2662263 RepID=UPI0013D2DBB0|nr:PhzF family phenazine biosynthesis protein [Paraferrimonas sp. SM1919]
MQVGFVDVFKQGPFSGNSAAVVILKQWLDDDLMQQMAAIHLVSETAFLVASAPDHYHVRWFSPLSEIDFCGHATMASAFWIFRQQPLLKTVTITAAAVGDMQLANKGDGYITMSLPLRPLQSVATPEVLTHSINQPIKACYVNQQCYVLELENEQAVVATQMDLEAIKAVAPRDVAVTAKSHSDVEFDFYARYFWPANGGDEDPVTGSLYTGIGPLWAEKLDKQTLTAFQASKRGGKVQLQLLPQRIELTGYCNTYMSATIESPDVIKSH